MNYMFNQMRFVLTGKPGKHPYPEHLLDSRNCAAEGMVLLKNENGVLPLKDKKIALFGSGAIDTVDCGTGSGFVNSINRTNVAQGLKNAGLSFTSSAWLNRFEKAAKLANKKDKTLSPIDRMWSGLKILIDDLPITEKELAQALKADTAVYVIRRNAGEGGDRKAEKGDYYISDIERANLELIAKNFKHTVVVLNTCVIDANFINEIPGIDGALLMVLPGSEGGNAAADVLTGKTIPSGRLVNTWAKKYSDYPASATFSANDGNTLQEDYCEDIFVGYRYFDSFGIEPLYPFGYGLSYTSFDMTLESFTADWNEVVLKVKVTNTGSAAGKEVVQVYVTAPEGKLVKPYQELRGFAKTSVLAPNASETVEIRIPTESLASYDTERASFILEGGDYIFRVGNHSRSAKPMQIIRIDGEAVVRKVSNKVCPDKELETIVPPARKPEEIDAPICELHSADCVTIDGASKIERVTTAYVPSADTVQPNYGTIPFPCENVTKVVRDCSDATLIDVKEGRVSIEEFVASLDIETLLRLVAGAANETPHSVPVRKHRKLNKINAPTSSGSTSGLFFDSLAIPKVYYTDGPAGLHLPGCGVTCYPVGMLSAQTWNIDCAKQMGIGLGKELKAYSYGVLLGPGMNIHRDPLCGRIFEYFSEDPLLSGKFAANLTIGLQQTEGASVAIKHFACNNQENDRTTQNSTVSERALREIYLRGFEICVREAKPDTVMSSYNMINGIHTSSHYELLTDILRGEWGFDGLVMTDWGSQSIKPYDLHAGNDIIMGGYRSQFFKAAYLGSEPEFTNDGYVVSQTFNVYGGFFKETIEHWNSFELGKDGADTVSTTVAAGVALNEKVAKKVEEGIASITDNADGSKTVTYKGTSRGSYLTLGDIQKCAINVLKHVMKSRSYMIMVGEE